MPFKASFAEKLDFKEPIALKIYISADNLKQKGEYLEAFINLINKEKQNHKISKLNIIDTTYLHRHYKPKFGSKVGKSEWLRENENYLKKLQLEYEVISYHLITEKIEYKELYKLIEQDFRGDKDGNYVDDVFKEKVLTLANEFSCKGDRTLAGAIKFILDECAGYIVSSEGYATYPGELNAPVAYALEKYKNLTNNPVFIPYKIKGKTLISEPKELPSTKNNSYSPLGYSPTFFGQSVAYHVDNLHMDSPKKQLSFFSDFLTLCQKYSSDLEMKMPNDNGLIINKEDANNGKRFNKQ